MKIFYTFCVSFLFSIVCSAQFKYDNNKYKTVYLEDLCATLTANPGYLLLDVRSPGEFADTSQFPGYNMGAFNKAINIDIRKLDKQLSDLQNYQQKPIFVYCSHSQRSRRASVLLADNGFTKVYNINAGMSGIRLHPNLVPCASELVSSGVGFKWISPAEMVYLLNSAKAAVYDIRPDSSFKGIAQNEKSNAFGKIKGAIHIPYEELESKLPEGAHKKIIVLVDEHGDKGAELAARLVKSGFTDVRVVMGGFEELAETPEGKAPGISAIHESGIPYKLVLPENLDAYAKENVGLQVVDTRPEEQFQNRAKEEYLNKGNIKGAMNIPYKNLDTELSKLDKSKPVLLYHFSGSPEVFQFARKLTEGGFTNVAVLMGGLFTLRWKAANEKGMENLNSWVVNIPEAGR